MGKDVGAAASSCFSQALVGLSAKLLSHAEASSAKPWNPRFGYQGAGQRGVGALGVKELCRKGVLEENWTKSPGSQEVTLLTQNKPPGCGAPTSLIIRRKSSGSEVDI